MSQKEASAESPEMVLNDFSSPLTPETIQKIPGINGTLCGTEQRIPENTAFSGILPLSVILFGNDVPRRGMMFSRSAQK